MKVGLVGEAPGDTGAVQNLLSRNYENLDFIELLQRVGGSVLDDKKAVNQIRREYEIERPDLVLVIRDLDADEKDDDKVKDRKKKFAKLNRIINKKGIFLLNIYELEALILADIEVFNKIYGCEVEQYADPMKVADPKEVLMSASRKSNTPFNVSHNREIFKSLRFDILKKNCRYFARFIKEFDKKLL
ncbi:MAG TPA: DUF4276 family protein [Mucilaginibacter sp.]|jgi:hypothetical protein|nr:DUF4276 family protein [Mucilaginibacter sp.]